HQVVQESQPLGPNLSGQKIDASCVAARPGKASDQTKLDRVLRDAEDDRNRRGGSLGRAGTIAETGCSDHGHTPPNELSHERWQAVVLAIQPVVLDHHVLALDVASFVEGFTKRSAIARGALG